MKSRHRYATGLVTLSLLLPAAADVIYSNFRNIAIPTTYDGLYLDVDGPNGWNTDMFAPVAGWDINPFFGGMAVANSPAFQPVRSGTGDLSPIVALTVGATIGSGSVFATGTHLVDNVVTPNFGGSETHLGVNPGQFTAGTEGYLGFKLDNQYGWMRVVFTNNTGGAVIKDWAYDTSGASIRVGNVQQTAADQPVTLNSAGGSFTLGSQITGTNSVLKTGANSATLTGTNNYSGPTDVEVGKLLVNGSLTGSGTVTVASGATLGGTGSIAGAVTINGGILSPGASIESLSSGALSFNGGTFEFEMNSTAVPSLAADFQKVLGDLNLTGSVALTLADLAGGSAVAFAPNTRLSLIEYTGSWNGGFFSYDSNVLSQDEVFTAGLTSWRIHYGATSGGLNFAADYQPGGKFITLTAIPEPGSWLALGGLVGSGLGLRSRRRR